MLSYFAPSYTSAKNFKLCPTFTLHACKISINLLTHKVPLECWWNWLLVFLFFLPIFLGFYSLHRFLCSYSSFLSLSISFYPLSFYNCFTLNLCSLCCLSLFTLLISYLSVFFSLFFLNFALSFFSYIFSLSVSTQTFFERKKLATSRTSS